MKVETLQFEYHSEKGRTKPGPLEAGRNPRLRVRPKRKQGQSQDSLGAGGYRQPLQQRPHDA